MSISALELALPAASSVVVNDDTLTVELSDGRSLAVPLSWFPRLAHGDPKERQNWRLIGSGQGIRWDDLDEDISIESLIAGRGSQESQASLAKWLKSRKHE
jgi:hypothetical protein